MSKNASDKQFDQEMERYQAEKAEYDKVQPLYLEAYQKIRNELTQQREETQKEYDAASSVLISAYSANIIPMQFRNITGVYYLYDYLSTSNQSLSEALMQANLEAIKQKLDTVISQQSELIIETAQLNAKMGKVMEYTEATMQNTAVAAQYARITAANTDTIRIVAQEQLAYQKFDTWMKYIHT